MVQCQIVQNVFSLCHNLSNQHKYKVSNSDLFLPESEREGDIANGSTNKDAKREIANTNKCTEKRVVDLENVPSATLPEELQDPENIPLATLEAELLKFDSENETLE